MNISSEKNRLIQDLKNNPSNAKFRQSLAEIYFNEDHYAEALAESEIAIKIEPNFLDAYRILGAAAMALGNYERAFEAFDEALKIEPNNVSVNHQMGILYDRIGQYEDAISFYRTATKYDPNNTEVHMDLGLVYDQLQRFEDAIAEFKEVLRIEPDEIEAYFRLGLIYDSFMDGENALLYTLKAEKLAEEQNALHWLADAQKSKRILIKRYELDPENYNQGDGYSF